jgi:hypothetical protein
MTDKQQKYLLTFVNNLNEGIEYYNGMLTNLKDAFAETKASILSSLEESKNTLRLLMSEIEMVPELAYS